MKPYRALVLDDDFAVANLHRKFVDDHPDFTVVGVAHNVAQAKRLLLELKPDLLLLDLYLPDENGLNLLSWLRADTELEVEVIAVTADRDLKSVRTARHGGVFHYLVKPFTVKQLYDRLSDLVSSWRQIDQVQPQVIDQHTIDAIMGGTKPIPIVGSRVNELPKGLSPHTLELVLTTLRREKNDVSAQELGALVGISRVSARRYLDYLAARGTVQIVPKYGTAGRPELRYKPMEDAAP